MGDCLLGTLMAGKDKFYFTANADGIVVAKKFYPIEMLLFTLNVSDVAEYDTIPSPFSSYLNATDRRDLVAQANISAEDNDFIKLYKLAGLKLQPAPFTIKQA